MFALTEVKRELDSAMEKEVKLLESFGEKEERIRAFIFDNDWSGLERVLKEVEPISEEIDLLEKRRNELFCSLKEALGKGPEEGFYQTIVHFSPEEREKSSLLYRNLKLSVIKIQGITWSIDAHVKSITCLMQKILNEQLP